MLMTELAENPSETPSLQEAIEKGTPITRKEIEDILPHRGDMALLNRVNRIAENKLIAEVTLAHDAFWVPGHFPVPEQQPSPRFEIGPLFPGVLMVESSAQAGICLWRMAMGMQETAAKTMLFKEISDTKFQREARPGERILIDVDIEKASLRLMRVACKGWVEKDLELHPAFTCKLAGMAV